MTDHPTFGVEEEFLLADPTTGEPLGVNRAVADAAARRGVELQLELTSCQIETTSEVASSCTELGDDLRRLRRVTADSAHEAGARLLAVALPPTLPQEFPVTDKPRYRAIAERFGMIAHEQGISGCHVHVAVPDRSAALGVANRLRPWLPLLLALTANSAIYRNADTGHASWRSVLWARWPSAGPPPEFASVDEYDATVQMMLDSGVMLDDGMVYWDVRPSANFPTIEVRVADVPATVGETVLFASLVRGLVMTALDAEREGQPLTPLSPLAMKAAYWKAAREGLDGSIVDLADTHALVPTIDLVDGLIERIEPALRAVGDLESVRSGWATLASEGNGAMRQRSAWRERNDVADVVAEATRATLAGV